MGERMSGSDGRRGGLRDAALAARTWSRAAAVTAALGALAGVLMAAGIATAGAAAPASPVASAAATCVIKRYTASGRKVTVFQTVYAYKGKGAKRRIVRKRVALRGPCSTPCAVTRSTAVGRVIVYVRKRVRVRVKRGKVLVTVTLRRRVPKLGKCVKPKGTTAPGGTQGLPVKVTILTGSKAILDFGSFVREAPLSGTLSGFTPGKKVDIKKDINVIFTKGNIALEPTPIFIDDDCGGDVTASIATGDVSIGLDPSRQSSTVLGVNQVVTASVFVRIKTSLLLRDGDEGCNAPYITTGYTITPAQFFFRGKLGTGGLTRLEVKSGDLLLRNFDACIGAGLPTNPCDSFSIPFPFIVRTDIFVKVDLKLF